MIRSQAWYRAQSMVGSWGGMTRWPYHRAVLLEFSPYPIDLHGITLDPTTQVTTRSFLQICAAKRCSNFHQLHQAMLKVTAEPRPILNSVTAAFLLK